MEDNVSLEPLFNDKLSDPSASLPSSKRDLRVKVVENALAGSIVDGRTTVSTAGTPVQLSLTSKPCMGVFVSGDIGNTNTVMVGASTVDGISGSQRGIALEPAGNSIFIPVNNLNLLYADAISSGDKIVWAYLVVAT